MLDNRLALGELGGDEPVIGLEHHDRIGRLVLFNIFNDTRDAISRDRERFGAWMYEHVLEPAVAG